MVGRVGGVVAIAGASLGSIWLLKQQSPTFLNTTKAQAPHISATNRLRFSWMLRAEQQQKRLPIVYFIIRYSIFNNALHQVICPWYCKDKNK